MFQGLNPSPWRQRHMEKCAAQTIVMAKRAAMPDPRETEIRKRFPGDPMTELNKLAAARAERTGETHQQAFAKVYESPEGRVLANLERDARLTVASGGVSKLATRQVDPLHQAAAGISDDTGSDSYRRLQAKAAKLRSSGAVDARGRPLTEAQAFDRVYSDPANRELANAHRNFQLSAATRGLTVDYRDQSSNSIAALRERRAANAAATDPTGAQALAKSQALSKAVADLKAALGL
jgi:hypothetical protein